MLRNIDRYFKGKNIDYKKYYKKNNNYLNIIVIKWYSPVIHSALKK